MSGKHLSWLAVAVIVVIGAVLLFVPGQTGREAPFEPGLAVPGLAERVNQAQGLEVRAAGDRVVATVVRGDDSAGENWLVEELDGYPADWVTVAEVLSGLARSEVIEPKTDNPAYYDRLGVEDVAGEDATGLLLTVRLPGEPVRVIVGDEAPSRGGRYLRRAGAARSVLADFDVDVPEDALGWVDEDVVDLGPAEVAEVEVIHPDGERLRVRKVSADETDFTLEGLPEGRELASSWSVNALGGLLSGLVMDDVRAAEEIDWSGALALRTVTFDGLAVDADLVEAEGQRWLRLSASAPFTGEAGTAPASREGAKETPDAAAVSGSEAGNETGDEAAVETDEETPDAQARADAINARVAGWAYALPAYKADAMNKRLEDLLKPLEDGSVDGQGGS